MFPILSYALVGEEPETTVFPRIYRSSASVRIRSLLVEQIVAGLAPANLPSSELDWEVTTQTDIGLDLGLVDERIRLTADYYIKNTTNLLAQVQLPLSVGFNNVTQNIGELRNSGIELGLGGDIFVGNFRWSVDANFSTNRNEIVSLKDGNDVFAAGLPGGASVGAFHIIREG